MSSRIQIRPDASVVSGSGNEPRSMYVITRRLSQPMISAASATPTTAGITSTSEIHVVARDLPELRETAGSARGRDLDVGGHVEDVREPSPPGLPHAGPSGIANPHGGMLARLYDDVSRARYQPQHGRM